MKNYLGHKGMEGVYQKIINEIPICATFVEMFAGSAVISKKVKEKSPETRVICNEIDRKVIDKYNYTANITYDYNALFLINMLGDLGEKHTCAFFDPPYLHSTRPNNTKIYKHEMSDNDHKQLLTSILQLKCQVIVIHPQCTLYDTLEAAGWRSVEIKIRYHSKISIEKLYMNFEASALLITDYVGKNATDRQRIKRKSDRWINRLDQLPIKEKQYLLNQISTRYF